MIDPLTGMLISGGLGLAGDSLDALFGAEPVAGGSSITESLGMGGKNTTPYEASILAQEKMKSEIPGLMKQLNYNAMGQSGEAARQGADIALSNWQNTNQARNASAAMNQDASNLRGLGISQGQLAMRNNQAQAAKTRTSIAEMLARSGASPAAIAAASAKAMGDQQAANANTLQQSMQAQSANLAQAGQMSGAANQVLQEDLKTQYNKVTPYLNQMQDLGSAMSNITNAGSAAQQNLTSSKTTMQGETRPLFEGLQTVFGKTAADIGGKSAYAWLFNEKPTK